MIKPLTPDSVDKWFEQLAERVALINKIAEEVYRKPDSDLDEPPMIRK